MNVVNEDSFMFHKPDLSLLERQAEELGIDLVVVGSAGEKEKELDDLRSLIGQIKGDVGGVVVGGIASSYQETRVKKICDEFGLKFVAPLWNYSSEKVWKELLNSGFEVILTKIACDGLGKNWIGKVIDRGVFEELKKIAEKKKFRIDFEGGEAESAVLFMPGYKNKIKLEFDILSDEPYRHIIKIKKIK